MPSVLFSIKVPELVRNPDGEQVEVIPILQDTVFPLIRSVIVNRGHIKCDHDTQPGYHITFQVEQDLHTDAIITALESAGVGHEFGSIAMTDLSFALPIETDDSVDSTLKMSVTSRLVIRQLLHDTLAASAFSFDYIMLCIMGSVIASMGLAIASPAIIVASMLVSPILGPILATAFGTVLWDLRLLSQGLRVELAGLAMCIVTGFVTGVCLAPWGHALGFPTSEMLARGDPYSGLIIGAAIAIPSGIGVGLSVLGSNMPGLIGVAISASLLPPAANCGLLLAYGLVGERLHGYKVASQDMYFMGTVSLTITILNIACIYAASILIFRIKEVVPLPHKTDLWKTFIPEVRRQNRSDIHDERLEQIVEKAASFTSQKPRASSIFGQVLTAQRGSQLDDMVTAARQASHRAIQSRQGGATSKLY